MRYFGPFKIIKKINAVAYKLKLLEGGKIHPTFHISKLKLYKEDNSEREVPDLPKQSILNLPILIPIAFTDYRVIYNKEVKVAQLLVR